MLLIAPLTCGDEPVQSAVDRVALLGDRDLERDRPADIDPVVVDMVEEVVDAVGQLADRGAGHPLGIIDQLGHILRQLVAP